MATDLKFMMRVHNLIQDIHLDDDLDANAKLFCLLVLADIARRRTLSPSARLAETVGWINRIDERAGQPYFSRMVIRRDVPRYEREQDTGVCVGEMIRRDGPCGKKVYKTIVDVDPATGREVLIGYCTRHWSLDHEQRAREQRRQWYENGRPRPPVNAGGVLRRHLSTDWDYLYDWADPHRDHAEDGKEPIPPRPTLSLIQGGV
ncbi:hypothetical protein EF294_03320 [Gordonia oryzae]|uniref:Uncharacterized protein n=1 Tax=Gordonia oryzae TaxID=2487349 RepID=A0A3N4H4N2_9ACTN|nr:hypothetical protein [Gordonia oryzae]RPA65780.1 hypothetical protein EF294_03320 [Gordonia oryzae]